MTFSNRRSTMFYVGLDIGGTKLLAAMGDQQGRILDRVQEATPHDLQLGLDTLNCMIAAVT